MCCLVEFFGVMLLPIVQLAQHMIFQVGGRKIAGEVEPAGPLKGSGGKRDLEIRLIIARFGSRMRSGEEMFSRILETPKNAIDFDVLIF